MQNQALQLLQSFLQREETRKAFPLYPLGLKSKLQFQEITIRSEFDHDYKKSDKKKVLKKQINEYFMHAYKEFTRQQKVQYYDKTVDYMEAIIYNKKKINFDNESFEGEGFTKSYHLKMWKLKNIRFDCKRSLIFGQKQGIVKTYDLSNYVYRKSKSNNKDYHTFVLEAINGKPYESMRTVHFGFKNLKNFQIFSKNVIMACNLCLYQSLKNQICGQDIIVNQINYNQIIENKQQKILMKQKNLQRKQSYPNTPQQHQRKSSIDPYSSSLDLSPISHQLVEENVVQKSMIIFNEQNVVDDRDRSIDIVESSKEIDIGTPLEQQIYECQIHKLKKILPDYDFKSLQKEETYQKLQLNIQDDRITIFKGDSSSNSIKIKINISNSVSIQKLVALLTRPQLIKSYNKQIEEFEIKTMIKSQNTALMYQKNCPFNKLYRARDFLFLRHVYSQKQTIFIIDKSIQDPQYPPFITIVRGTLQIIWGIYTLNHEIKIVGDLQINHQGYLNQSQNYALTLKYLKEFLNILNQLGKEGNDYQIFHLPGLASEKKITTNSYNSIAVQPNYRESMRIAAQTSVQTNNIYSNFNNLTVQTQIPNELKPQEIKEMEINKTKIEEMQKRINQNGEVIIDDTFRKIHYQIAPLLNCPYQYLGLHNNKDHPIWKGQWKLDPDGGIIFVNQKKISDQKGVLKFILSQIGKNLISGKSVLNISLPVDIFAPISNLQLHSLSMMYAPLVFEKKVGASPLQQLKALLAFGISMSSTYLIMEKPFNPVLGQTFQSYINGCPLYAEQISHHPPISALYFVGRGYTLSGQLQSKASLSVNSGYGSNDGVYSVQFEKGSKVRYIGPYGEVSGLIYGERKFNIIGKAYCWIEEENLLVEIVFNPKKGFFRKGNALDYFQGIICETTSSFMKNFVNSKKKVAPSKSQIVKEFGKLHGIWHKQIKFQQDVLLDIDVQFPLKMKYEKNPLPSDSNWREDITYRKFLQTTKAQKYKEAIQIKQRADRKLREQALKRKK